MSFFDQLTRHQQMSRAADPRDTNGDGVVSPQEAAVYVQEYLNQASPEERNQILHDYIGSMTPEQRQQMGDAIVQSSANPIQKVNIQDTSDLANAYTQVAQAPRQTSDGPSPLEAAFAPGGALSNPLVKAGLVGLAAAIGSKMMRR